MAKYRATVTVTLEINYNDIYADDEEQANRIAVDMAREDVVFDNCECNDDFSACSWLEE
jgi:hypothetical protein